MPCSCALTPPGRSSHSGTRALTLAFQGSHHSRPWRASLPSTRNVCSCPPHSLPSAPAFSFWPPAGVEPVGPQRPSVAYPGPRGQGSGAAELPALASWCHSLWHPFSGSPNRGWPLPSTHSRLPSPVSTWNSYRSPPTPPAPTSLPWGLPNRELTPSLAQLPPTVPAGSQTQWLCLLPPREPTPWSHPQPVLRPGPS